MNIGKRKSLLFAAVLLVAPPAMACQCLADLAAVASAAAVEASCCQELAIPDPAGCDHSEPSDCADCSELDALEAEGALAAIASSTQSAFKLPPALVQTAPALVRTLPVRLTGPPFLVARSAQTPVVLKQRLLN